MARGQLNGLKTFCKSVAGIGTLTVAAFIAMTISPAAAQEPMTVLDRLEKLAEDRSGDYFRNRSLSSQISSITGIGGFPENQISKDAESIAEAYDELLMLQAQSTPSLRVLDLPNPYTTSVQLLPSSEFGSHMAQ